MTSQHIQSLFQTLNICCGNFRLGGVMYEDDYQHLTNIGISFTFIKQMQELYKEKIPNLALKQMDVRSLKYEESTYKEVIGKGTFDFILSGSGFRSNAD